MRFLIFACLLSPGVLAFVVLASRASAHVSTRVPHLLLAADDALDMNAAMTALNAAVEAEDYAEAARLKKLIAEAAPEAADQCSWTNGDTVLASSEGGWLLERLEALGYRFPTLIQAAAVRTTRDAALRAPTGSGKTLAFLVPLIANAIPMLEKRGEATVEAVASMDLSPTDALGALAPALSTGVPMANPFAAVAGQGGALVGGAPLRGAPLVVVLTPRESLAEQVATLAYSAAPRVEPCRHPA